MCRISYNVEDDDSFPCAKEFEKKSKSLGSSAKNENQIEILDLFKIADINVLTLKNIFLFIFCFCFELLFKLDFCLIFFLH